VRPAPPLDLTRAARASMLTAWAAFFGWLLSTGEVARYLGPRTLWVAAFGAVALTGAALAQLWILRRSPPRRLGRAEAVGLAILLAPVVATVAVPQASLGALAASRKATSQGALALGSLAAPEPDAARPVSFIDVHFANASEAYAQRAGIADGTRVTLLGFVTSDGEAPPGTFELTRFYVSCCAADALPYSVTVDARGPAPPTDAWLQVAGSLSRTEDGWVVVADTVSRRPEPDDPYLS
jgi:putative membrane protein